MLISVTNFRKVITLKLFRKRHVGWCRGQIGVSTWWLLIIMSLLWVSLLCDLLLLQAALQTLHQLLLAWLICCWGNAPAEDRVAASSSPQVIYGQKSTAAQLHTICKTFDLPTEYLPFTVHFICWCHLCFVSPKPFHHLWLHPFCTLFHHLLFFAPCLYISCPLSSLSMRLPIVLSLPLFPPQQAADGA